MQKLTPGIVDPKGVPSKDLGAVSPKHILDIWMRYKTECANYGQLCADMALYLNRFKMRFGQSRYKYVSNCSTLLLQTLI